MRTFEFNGKYITPRVLTYNDICELEEMGYDIESIDTKPMSFTRAFVALWEGVDFKEAGNLIEAFIANGGNLPELLETIEKSISESGFFKSVGETPQPNPKLKKTPEPTESDS